MAAASLPVVVDGVRCRLNFKSSCVTVGTSAAERRLVKPFVFDGDAAQATAAQVEAQVRARPGFDALAARAVQAVPPAANDHLAQPSDAEPAQAAAPPQEELSASSEALEREQRGGRLREQVQLFEPPVELREKATGARWSRKRPAAAQCADSCQQEHCKRARAERDEALRVASAAQEQLDAVRAEMALLVEGLEGDEKLGAAALQQALLAVLDDEEEGEEAEETSEDESDLVRDDPPRPRDSASFADHQVRPRALLEPPRRVGHPTCSNRGDVLSHFAH